MEQKNQLSINMGNNEYPYPKNFYEGCGTYIAAIKDGKIVATMKVSISMLEEPSKELYLDFETTIELQRIDFDYTIPIDGSGASFFMRSEEMAKEFGIKVRVYYVASARGGMHKNIEVLP